MKGSMIDIAVGFGFVFAIALSFIATNFVYTKIADTGLFESGPSNNTQARVNFEQGEKVMGIADTLFPVILGALFIGLVISALIIPSHPVFAIAMILGISVSIGIIGVFFSNTYADIAVNTTLSSSADSFRLTKVVMDNFPILIVVIGFIAAIMMYAKSRDGGFSR